jgi:hypothetical protein
MSSQVTPEFWEALNCLPLAVQRLARKNYLLWRREPQHPSIRFKYVGDGLWSARVGLAYRALAVKEGALVIWYWIGHHSEYDQLLKQK